MKKFAVIVAGGVGSRMKADIPKQFLPLHGKPILMRTIEAFFIHDSQTTIIVTLPESHLLDWEELISTFHFNINHQVIPGGATRFDSVKNGLAVINQEDGLVAIHDGARPLISPEGIARAYNEAAEKQNSVMAVGVKDSLRIIEGNKNTAVDRSKYVSIQTPQTFNIQLIKDAFSKAKGNHFSDDASVVEETGTEINMIPGEYSNLKITTPEDLIMAHAIYKKKTPD